VARGHCCLYFKEANAWQSCALSTSCGSTVKPAQWFLRIRRLWRRPQRDERKPDRKYMLSAPQVPSLGDSNWGIEGANGAAKGRWPTKRATASNWLRFMRPNV
jgi:hypothetical protein